MRKTPNQRKRKRKPSPMITMNLVGEIGERDGIVVEDVVRKLRSVRADEPVEIHLHSGGGDYMGGLAIAAALGAIENSTVIVESLAASIASVVALAAKRVKIARDGWIMLHRVNGKAEGDADFLQQRADLLTKTDAQLVDIYTRETGAPPEQVRAWMAEETWFDAEAAMASGFVDEIVGPSGIRNSVNLSRFAHVPDEVKRTLAQPAHDPTNHMTKLLTALNELKLVNCACGGGAAAPNEDDLVGQLKASLAALTAERDTLQSRLEALEKEMAGMRANSTATLQARATAAVDGVIAEGRLAPSLRAVMVDAYTRDEATALKNLADLPKASIGTAPLPRGSGADGGAKTMKDKILSEPDPKKRIELLTANWNTLNGVVA